MTKPQIIFLGNGPLADSALNELQKHCEIIFHAHDQSDLTEVVKLKQKHPHAHAVLASFGVIITPDILEIFEPEGILNIHPSSLPRYRGPSPIESAILNGDTTFGTSVMKLAPQMDAGPIYYQTTYTPDDPTRSDLKSHLYRTLASLGAQWLNKNFTQLPTPVKQNSNQATFTKKLTKKDGILEPDKHPASVILHQIIAYQGFPKPKYTLEGINCTILEAHLANPTDTPLLSIKCADGAKIAIDLLQPASRRPMDTKSFMNGLRKRQN
ncbi:hypothetical protein IJI91_02645 [Candidatus Saccharibacteria bacterium]|nr:hypothetical protein [Candidatus Saccharibacteria bacterium]